MQIVSHGIPKVSIKTKTLSPFPLHKNCCYHSLSHIVSQIHVRFSAWVSCWIGCCASHVLWNDYNGSSLIWMEVFLQSLEVKEKNCGGSSFSRSFTIVGSHMREGNWTSILLDSSHINEAIVFVVVAFSWMLSCLVLYLTKNNFKSFALVGYIAPWGWKR